jgi:hypothetical protein
MQTNSIKVVQRHCDSHRGGLTQFNFGGSLGCVVHLLSLGGVATLLLLLLCLKFVQPFRHELGVGTVVDCGVELVSSV